MSNTKLKNKRVKAKFENTISTTEALTLLDDRGLNVTLTTLITWIEKKKLGRKPLGRWRIDKEKFLDFIDRGGD